MRSHKAAVPSRVAVHTHDAVGGSISSVNGFGRNAAQECGRVCRADFRSVRMVTGILRWASKLVIMRGFSN
jgi:hypothetical protein